MYWGRELERAWAMRWAVEKAQGAQGSVPTEPLTDADTTAELCTACRGVLPLCGCHVISGPKPKETK